METIKRSEFKYWDKKGMKIYPNLIIRTTNQQIHIGTHVEKDGYLMFARHDCDFSEEPTIDAIIDWTKFVKKALKNFQENGKTPPGEVVMGNESYGFSFIKIIEDE